MCFGMNRIVTVFLGLFLVVVLTVGGLIGYAMWNGPRLDASSKAYVDDALPRIMAHWSVDELLERGAPRIRAESDRARLRETFGRLAALGQLLTYDGAKGTSRMAFTPADGEVIGAVYLARATFEHGRAQVRVSLIQDHGRWLIQTFSVQSPVLLNAPAAPA